MQNFDYDIAIIGGGPAGYTAAIKASQLGFNTVLIESNMLGGVCLNCGCIPTKAILKSADLYQDIKTANKFGIDTTKCTFDLDKILEHSKKVVEKNSIIINDLLKKHNVNLIQGLASFVDNHTLKIKSKKDSKISAKYIIVAAGTKPKELALAKSDGVRIWTSKNAISPTKIPESLMIIGAGAIGLETASFYQRFGSKIYIVEQQNRILACEDSDISEYMEQYFINEGAKVYTSTTIEKIKTNKNNVTVKIKTLEDEKEITVENILVSVGIEGRLDDLSLSNTKIKSKNGHIVTDKFGKTEEDNIYAIGDIASAPWISNKARMEAVKAVEKIADVKGLKPINKERISSCVFTYPQTASVGLTEDQARGLGYDIKIGNHPFSSNGKAIAIGEDIGFIKTIFDKKTSALLGAHIVGTKASELISTFAIAMELETTEYEILNTIFPHPTLSESIYESTLDVNDKSINK